MKKKSSIWQRFVAPKPSYAVKMIVVCVILTILLLIETAILHEKFVAFACGISCVVGLYFCGKVDDNELKLRDFSRKVKQEKK